MKHYTIEQLEDLLVEGQELILGRDIYDSSGRPKLMAGVELNNRLISLLKRDGIYEVYLSDSNEELNEDPRSELDMRISDQFRLEISERTKEKLSGIESKIKADEKITRKDLSDIKSAMDKLADFIMNNPVRAICFSKMNNLDNQLYDNAVATTYFALTLATRNRGYINEEIIKQGHEIRKNIRIEIGIASYLRDVGMVEFEDIIKKQGKLTADEEEKIKTHPVIGAKLLGDNISSLSQRAIKEHHQAYDGTGYPGIRRPTDHNEENLRPAMGDEISVAARIIAIADQFVAMTSPRYHREAQSDVSALWEMTQVHPEKYDPVLLKSFSELVPPFPIGSKLKIENNGIMVVTGHNRHNPFRPRVLEYENEKGQRYQDKDGKLLIYNKKELIKPLSFNLDDQRGLKILECDGEDLSYLNK